MHQHFKPGKRLTFLLLFAVAVRSLSADTITVRGLIDQSTQDGTGSAINNPGLNEIRDGDAFSVRLDFLGSINSPGSYDLTDPVLVFSAQAAHSVEKSFGSVDVAVTQSGDIDSVSVFGCLTTGSGCNEGNELDLNFEIAPDLLNSGNVAAQPLSGLLPFDLLEDDGITDIQGTVTKYSYSPPAGIPEPPAILLFCSGVLAVALGRFRHKIHS